jgi:hypothetical protein
VGKRGVDDAKAAAGPAVAPSVRDGCSRTCPICQVDDSTVSRDSHPTDAGHSERRHALEPELDSDHLRLLEIQHVLEDRLEVVFVLDILLAPAVAQCKNSLLQI